MEIEKRYLIGAILAAAALAAVPLVKASSEIHFFELSQNSAPPQTSAPSTDSQPPSSDDALKIKTSRSEDV